MKRDKQEWLMDYAFLTAKMSTCARIKVGAVITKGARIISTGYNGSAPGREHCEDYFANRFKTLKSWNLTEIFKDIHHRWALENEIHAEINAILFAAKEGVSVYGAEIYITHRPCIICSKFIVQAGIKKVIYSIPYGNESDIKILKDNNVEVVQHDYN